MHYEKVLEAKYYLGCLLRELFCFLFSFALKVLLLGDNRLLACGKQFTLLCTNHRAASRELLSQISEIDIKFSVFLIFNLVKVSYF